MNEEGLNRISLRVPEAMFEDLKRKADEDRTTFQAVGIDLLGQRLCGDKPLSPPPERLHATKKYDV